jgi:predicted transcriptional regulator
MNEKEQIAAKATKPEEQSDGIVVSFAAEWHQPLLDNKFSVVIRKRVPKTVKSRWLYFHINAPVCAICGRAEIRLIDEIDLNQALSMSAKLALSPNDIIAYFGDDKIIGCYRLGKISFTKTALTKEALCTQLAYHPPQSFFILSHDAKRIIDSLAGFPKSAKKRP